MEVRFLLPTKMPDDLPIHCYDDDLAGTHLQARQITFDTMLFALRYIHEKTYKKEWTDFSKTAQYYASLECINTALAKRVYMNAKILRTQCIRDGTYDRESVPPMDLSSVPNILTSGTLTLDQCMVGIMHTLFLNGGKKVMLLVHDVFKKENLGAFF